MQENVVEGTLKSLNHVILCKMLQSEIHLVFVYAIVSGYFSVFFGS